MASSEEALAGAVFAPKANMKKFTVGKFPKAPLIAKGRVLGANDRILVGHIGLGGMGSKHVEHFKKLVTERNAQSIALSDVYSVRLEKTKTMLLDGDLEGTTVQAEKDYRKILENKDVDAVVIATPEHWHCQIAVHALQAGKHVYVEKPMARFFDESLQLYDAWRKSGKVVQIGSHGCSDPKYLVARDVVASGKLGPIVTVQSSYMRNKGAAGEWNDKIDPEVGPQNLDWEMWLGSAPRRPWNEDSKERFFRYRKYRDYSAGILGGLMSQRIYPLMMTLGGQDWPVKVQALGTRRVSTDREVSDTVHVIAEMQNGWSFLFVGSTVNEQGLVEMVRGHRASIYLEGKEPEVKAERPYVKEIEGGTVAVKEPGADHIRHQNNWLECIRENKQPNANVDLGIRAQAIISLAEISEVTKKTVLFDPVSRSWKFP